ncbi:MAG: hypothetical protein ACJASR_001096, partial [Psychroserpens sp.]
CQIDSYALEFLMQSFTNIMLGRMVKIDLCRMFVFYLDNIYITNDKSIRNS